MTRPDNTETLTGPKQSDEDDQAVEGEAEPSPAQLDRDAQAVGNRTRHLKAVPDADPESGDAAEEGHPFEPPDVIGSDRKRSQFAGVMTNLTEAELDDYAKLYRNHLSPKTVQSYEAALRPYYEIAHKLGHHPLKCDPVRIEAYLLHLMRSGKPGADGLRDPKSAYSKSHFKMFSRCPQARRGSARASRPDRIGRNRKAAPRLRPHPRVGTAPQRKNRASGRPARRDRAQSTRRQHPGGGDAANRDLPRLRSRAGHGRGRVVEARLRRYQTVRQPC